MPTVQKFSDDGSTAGGPGAGTFDLNECGRHHMVVLQFSKHILTGLHVVVRHVEHMPCQEERGCQMSFMNICLSVNIHLGTLGIITELMYIEWWMVLAGPTHQAHELW